MSKVTKSVHHKDLPTPPNTPSPSLEIQARSPFQNL